VKKAIFLCLVLVLCVSLFVGCSKSTTTTTAPKTTAPKTTAPTTTPPKTTAPTTTAAPAGPKYGGTFRYCLGYTIENAGGWIPELFVGTPTQVQLIYEPLLRGDDKGNIIPWLAEKYTVAPDLMSVTFNLRKGIKFSDGSDFNATVAKWNLDNFITSHRAYWTSVDFIDDYTVKCNAAFPISNTVIGGGLGGYSDSVDTWMASKAAYDAHGGDNGGKDWLRDNPVGTGPYIFKSYERDVAFKAVRNPNYWAKDANGNKLPYLDEFDIVYIPDPLTSKASLMAGEVDLATVSLGPDAQEVAASGAIGTTVSVTSNIEFVPDSLHADSPFSKQEVREAFEYAMNKEAVAKAFSYGAWKAPYQVGAQDTPYYDPNYQGARTYNVAKAKELLTSAGYPNGFHMTFICAPTGINKDIIQAYIEQLSAVGITADVEFPDAPKYMPDEAAGIPVSVMYVEPTGGIVNWNAFLLFSNNPTRPKAGSWYFSPEYVAAYNAAVNAPTFDLAKTKAVFKVMEDQCLIIQAYAAAGVIATQKYVHIEGVFHRSFSGLFNTELVWLDK